MAHDGAVFKYGGEERRVLADGGDREPGQEAAGGGLHDAGGGGDAARLVKDAGRLEEDGGKQENAGRRRWSLRF